MSRWQVGDGLDGEVELHKLLCTFVECWAVAVIQCD